MCQQLVESGTIDAVLLDTASGTRTGGTGRTHDWSVSRAVVALLRDTPVILAGGLTAANVRDAIDVAHPYAVDVLSGVKLQEGLKDHAKIRA